MATWAATTLCRTSDVRAEAQDLRLALLVDSESEQNRMIQEKINLAKEELRQKLFSGLRVRFHRYGVRDGGADVAGYSWEELDTLLDKLQNPSELKAAAVAVTIRKILEDGELRFTSQYNETSPALIKAREHWTRQAEDRVKIAVELLKFDLDADGEVDDSERAVSHANIWRG